MARSIRAVLFDFDGVIVDSEPLHLRGLQSVLAAEGIELSERQYYDELIGFDDRGAFRHAFAKAGRPLDDATFARVMAAKRSAVEHAIAGGEFTPLPGVDGFVRALAAGSHTLAICSGALRHEIETMLDGIGLREFFPIITAAEDVRIGKPDPSGYLLTMQRVSNQLGRPLRAGDCLIIEDAPSVVATTRPLGFNVLAVTTSHAAKDFAEASPNAIVDRLDETTVRAALPMLLM